MAQNPDLGSPEKRPKFWSFKRKEHQPGPNWDGEFEFDGGGAFGNQKLAKIEGSKSRKMAKFFSAKIDEGPYAPENPGKVKFSKTRY